LWRLHCKTGRKKWIYSWPAWLFPINHSYLVLIYYGVFCFLVIVKYLWSPITQILHSITWSCSENGVLLSYQRLLCRKARMDLIGCFRFSTILFFLPNNESICLPFSKLPQILLSFHKDCDIRSIQSVRTSTK
jgi:hypothetical protein